MTPPQPHRQPTAPTDPAGAAGTDHPGGVPSSEIALVTGAAHGIGEAVARSIVGTGGSVVLADIDEVAGARLADELGEWARFVRVDVTDEAAIERAFAVCVEAFGAPTQVFANAGVVGVTGRIEEHALADWQRTQELLLTSVFLTVKHAVAVMRPVGRGAIVATASVASVRGGLGPHSYTAAKHAVKGLVESVAVEISPYGLRINAVAPGGTVSSLSAGLMGDADDLDTPYQRLAAKSSAGIPTTSQDIADAALFLAGPGARRINGATVVIDGGDDVLATAGKSYYA